MNKLKFVNLVNQVCKFGIVGFFATILEWLMFFFFSETLKIHYLISVLFAYSFSTIFNYLFSIFWVFKVQNKNKKKFLSFLILSIIGLGINEILMLIFIEIVIINSIVSKILATFIVMVYNFITRKLFIEDRY